MDITSIAISLTILIIIFSIIFYFSTKKYVAGWIITGLLFFILMFNISPDPINNSLKNSSYLISQYSIYNHEPNAINN